MSPQTRRRSPGWVRAFSSPALHGLAMRMHREQQSEDLSDSQWWLWKACISELEYRWRAERHPLRRCSCFLCVPPFPEAAD